MIFSLLFYGWIVFSKTLILFLLFISLRGGHVCTYLISVYPSVYYLSLLSISPSIYHAPMPWFTPPKPVMSTAGLVPESGAGNTLTLLNTCLKKSQYKSRHDGSAAKSSPCKHWGSIRAPECWKVCIWHCEILKNFLNRSTVILTNELFCCCLRSADQCTPQTHA